MIKLGFRLVVLIPLIGILLVGKSQKLSAAGYDSTYVLAVTQKYAIPENVQNGDYVGYWKKTFTWKSGNAISYSIEQNWNNAFSINSSTGLITVSDASKINGKISQQDVVINLILKTVDAGIGYELDTAIIRVKENSYCIFIDYNYKNTELGTRNQPYKDLDNTNITKGYGYFIKRGNVFIQGRTSIKDLLATANNPTIIGAYGQGNRPTFNGNSVTGNSGCFYLGNSSDKINGRVEHVYFYNLKIRNYLYYAFKLERISGFVGFYNCQIYNNAQYYSEATIVMSTSNYSDSTAYRPSELIDCEFDTTSVDNSGSTYDGSPSAFIKVGVGPCSVINSSFKNSAGASVRFTTGLNHNIKHCFIDGYTASGVQARGDYAVIEDNRILNGGSYGVLIETNDVPNGPDFAKIKNNFIDRTTYYGVRIQSDSKDYNIMHDDTIEDCIIKNGMYGIYIVNGLNITIRQNEIINFSTSSIITKTSQGDKIKNIYIYNNVLHTGKVQIDCPVGNGMYFYNNTIDGNIDLTGASNTTVQNNYFRSLTNPDIASNNLDIDTLNTDKHFMNYSGHDYRLKSTAYSAIKKGVPIKGLTQDIAGTKIPAGKNPDIGAYEYQSADTSSTQINNPPVINDQNYVINDNVTAGYQVGEIVADDPDGQSITYRITDGNTGNSFAVDATSGNLTVEDTANLSSTDSLVLTVNVTDNDVNPLSDNAQVIIYISHAPSSGTDTNTDNISPVASDQNFVIYESNFDGDIGTFVATDPNQDQQLSYSIVGGNINDIFAINNVNGAISVQDPSGITFDQSEKYYLTIMVSDNAVNSKFVFGTATISFISNNTTYFIDPTNTDDPIKDGTIDHPYDSWQNVPWKAGYYYLQKSGTIAYDDNINIGADSVTLGTYGNGTLPIISSYTNTYVIRAYDKKGIHIENMNIVGTQAQSCIYFLGPNCENIKVEKCILEGASIGVRMVDGKNLLVQYNSFKNTESGVYSMAENTKAYYNVFSDSQTAINLASYLSEADVYNNVFYNNSEGISSSFSGLKVYNNIFYLTSAGDQAINQKLDKLISDHNIFYPEQSGFLTVGTDIFNTLKDAQQAKNIDLNSITSDPLFVDVVNNNFNIRFNSPAIDMGLNVGLDRDFYGYKVPSGGIPDIGIAEIMENMADKYSGINNQKTNDPGYALTTFPNPSTGIINVKIDSPHENMEKSTEIQVTDLTGKIVYKNRMDAFAGNGSQSMDLSGLPRGLYFVVMYLGKQQIN